MILPKCKKYGIDIAKRYINIAKIKNPEAIISLANTGKIPFRDNFFDFIFCTEVIEHVIKPIKLLNEIRRVLKKRGYVIISTYNHWNITNIINLKAFTKKFCSEDYLREYNYFSLKKILEKYFKINYFSSVGLTQRMKKIISKKYSIIPLYNFLIFLIKNEK